VIFGIIAMGPAAVLGEKYGKGKEVFVASVLFIIASFALMGFSSSFFLFATGATFFFIGFNMFEPLLQSFVAKFAKVHQKGAALGVANTFAYVGIFLGGAIGGWLYGHYEEQGVAIAVMILSVFWIFWILSMRNPALRKNLFLSTDIFDETKLHTLKEVEGVNDFYTNKTEKIMVIKYEDEVIDEDTLRGMLLK
jgi:MFS family permease